MSKAIELITTQSQNTAFFPEARFNNFYRGILSPYESAIAMYYLLVMGKYKKGMITIDDKEKPGSAIVVDIRLGRSPRIKSYFENGKPVIDIKLEVEGDVQSIQSRINYEELSKLSDLNNQVKEHLQNGIQKLIEKTQKELKADIFGFGHKVVDHFSTIQEWQKYNWLSHYPEAKVTVSIEVNVSQ